MAVIVSDSFKKEINNLGASTAETGQAWAVLQGGFAVDGWNQITYSNASPAIAVVDAGKADCSVSFTVNGIDTTGIILRQKQGTTINAIRVEFKLDRIQVVTLPAGTIIATQLITNEDIETAMKVVAEGSSIKVYKNNVLALTTTSTYNQTETRHGFYTSWDWANFSVFLIETVGTPIVQTKIGEYRYKGSSLPIYSVDSMPAANQLRTIHPTKGVGCFELVSLTDPNASPIRMNAKGTIKAIKKEAISATRAFPKGYGSSAPISNPANQLTLMKEAGLTVIRMDLYWSSIEETKGVYNLNVHGYTDTINDIVSRGFTPYCDLLYSNLNYETEGGYIKTEEGLTAFLKYVDAVTKQFAGKGIIWDIWNEPNSTFPEAHWLLYARLIKETAVIVKRNDPTGFILAPSVAGLSPGSFDFLELMFNQGILDYIDGVSVHPYRSWSPESVWYEYDVLRELIKEHTSKKIEIINGEWGYTTTKGWWDLNLTDKDQAANMVRMFMIDRFYNVPISIWYNWIDNSDDINESEHNFGILKFNGTPKDAYYALKAFTTNVPLDYTFANRIPVGNDDYYVFQYSKGTQNVYALWADIDWTEEVEITLPLTNVKGTLKGMLNESLGTFDSAANAKIKLTGYPKYLIVTG